MKSGRFDERCPNCKRKLGQTIHDYFVTNDYLTNFGFDCPWCSEYIGVVVHSVPEFELFSEAECKGPYQKESCEKPSIGDYVLATKYDDGDPCDHFYVGFVSGFTHHGRFLIVDNEGNNQRANGFRRAEKITADEGRRLVEMMPSIGDRPGFSLWWHLAKIRGEVN